MLRAVGSCTVSSLAGNCTTQSSRLFVIFILEKNCSQRYVVPKTDEHLRALTHKLGNSSFAT